MAPSPGTACIISTGEEVLRGELVDGNSAELARRLEEAGFQVQLMFTAGDRRADLRFVIETGLARADWVFMTGGLGPTEDDLTSAVVAECFGVALVFHPPSWAHIEARFREFGIPITGNNRKQALFPAGAQVLENPHGTAPGFHATRTAVGRTQHVVALPGPPREMVPMLDALLADLPGARRPQHSFMRFFGIGESSLAEVLRPWADASGVALGYRALFPEIEVKLYDASAAQTASLRAFVLEKLADCLLDFRSRATPELLAEYLAGSGLTVGLAESCTGGLAGKLITDQPGASAYFRGAVVSYHNDIKRDVLGVPQALIEAHGAVSEPVARAMAEGACTRLGADVALAVTGIAGPEGGSAAKPVGTVWLAKADAAGTQARCERFVRGREWVRIFAAYRGLRWLMEDWLRERWQAAVKGP
jgi:nicotinamide-nucleotide amidase